MEGEQRMRLAELREAVVRAAQEMSRLGLVEFTAGNVSARDADTGLVVITPGSVEYPGMTAADTVLVDAEGNVVEGPHKASSETLMHCAIYKRRSDVGGVVHTHSPWATTFAVLGPRDPRRKLRHLLAGKSRPDRPGFAQKPLI